MNQRIGYARISIVGQHLDLQRDALMQSECGIFYEDVCGKNSLVSEFDQCLKALRTGDTLVVWRLDRLGFSLTNLVKFVENLELRGVHFESLTEKINTNSAVGKSQLHVFAALAESERTLTRERIQVVGARARGRVGGRKPKLDDQQVKEIKVILRDPDIRVTDVARRYGISRTTLYKYVGIVKPCQ